MRKRLMTAVSILLIGFLIPIGMVDVMADDDDDNDEYFEYEGMKFSKDDDKKLKKEYKRFKKERKYNDDDFDHDEDREHDDEEIDDENKTTDFYEGLQLTQNHYWNIWSRSLHVQKGGIPFSTPEMVTFIQEQRPQSKFYVIPNESELYVPSMEIAKYLGGNSHFYPNSKIVVIESEGVELIVKAGTNVAYENRIKTPMPAKAMYYQQSVYIPISVIANALGYIVEWSEEEGSINFEKSFIY